MAMMEGALSKWTNVMKGWQYRWFVLDENAGLLSYYTSKEKMMKGVRRGCVRLKGAIIGIDDQDVNTFTITVDHKTFHFQAKDSEEREKWVRRLEDTIMRHVSRTKNYWDTGNGQLSMSGSGSSLRLPNYLKKFDKRVSEADTFLQLMIEQTAKINEKLHGDSEDEDRRKYNHIKEHATAMLDNIKHSIVYLQIAKNTAHPITGIYNGPIIRELEMSSEIMVSSETNTPNADAIENKKRLSHLDSADREMDSSLPYVVVPETSYSSSEGEDDYFDANDDLFYSVGSSPTSPTCNYSSTRINSNPVTVKQEFRDKEVKESITEKNLDIKEISIKDNHTKSSIPVKNDGSLDFDALYEDDSDTDLSMESHGSVITHLLSQVKIGMDLTKVVLPTFILERRSLLEMYADYFAHPDLFLKIVDFDDPKDRMIQVVRWYLSVYHAGRKSAVAKKPYNPILGEIFQCHWNLDDQQSDLPEVSDGPVPWCKQNQLTFIAEQVSHHPPISAFYAEHYAKRISFTAHVWTKSKFLGLSIGVHNIGQGIVTLCDRNEEYILTFPNGYGRSILTVPWIELGGAVTINCPKTGYHADIEFLTKPFYGGKRNRIQGEIFAPGEKKSFLSISGEWSGQMEAKYNDGSKSKSEVFIDVNKIPIYKKNVRPISMQSNMESRNVWKEVTAGLKLNDIDRATTAKCTVENKQRNDVKIRKEFNQDWITNYFKPVGDAWIYKSLLSQRLLSQPDNKMGTI